MLAQTSDQITVPAVYKLDGKTVTGLTITCQVVWPDNSTTTPTVTEVGTTGVYKAAPFAATQTGDYVFIYSAPLNTTDERDIVGLKSVGVAGLNRLDVNNSTINTAVNTVGGLVSQTKTATDAIKATVDTNLNATISSRATNNGVWDLASSPYRTASNNMGRAMMEAETSSAHADTEVGKLALKIPSDNVTKMARLDATISSRASSAELTPLSTKLNLISNDILNTPENVWAYDQLVYISGNDNAADRLLNLDGKISLVPNAVWETGAEGYDNNPDTLGGYVFNLGNRTNEGVADAVWGRSADYYDGGGLDDTLGGYIFKFAQDHANATTKLDAIKAKVDSNLDVPVSTRATPEDLSGIDLDDVVGEIEDALGTVTDSITAISFDGVTEALDQLTGAVSGLASSTVTIGAESAYGVEVAMDMDFDRLPANGQPLTFNGSGALSLDSVGIYRDGAKILDGVYTATDGGYSIKVGVSRAQASTLGRGVHSLELGYEKNGVRTLITKVKLRVL